VTIVTDNFITLFYGLVLRRSFIHSPDHRQLIVTLLTWHVTNSWPNAPTETFVTHPAMLELHVDSILKPRLH